MKIIVCGAGQVGSSIARQLSQESNDVTIIDHSPDHIRKITDSLDVNAVIGFASHPTVLEEAGAEYADMIIAVTASDEVNMIACQVAHSLFKIPMKIARVRHQNYLHEQWHDLYRQDHLPIDVIISPELEVSFAVNHRLHVPGALDTIPYADGQVKVVAVRCTMDCPLANLLMFKVKEFAERINVAILGIARDQQFIIPRDKDQLLPGDELFFVTDQQHIPQAMALFGHQEREARRLLIVGGGNIGFYLAQQLEAENPDTRIKIIEINKERAHYIAERLDRVSVIHGNALEQEILEEANISATETVIAVSNDDEVNILASLLSKRFGCQRALALINSRSYAPLISTLGIDVVVNPREITVSSILQHIRRGRIRSAHSICNGAAEIIEAEAIESSAVVGKTIHDLGLPPGVSMGVIIRGSRTLIPTPDTVIRANDRIIMISLTEKVKEIEHIFTVKFEYF